MGAALWGPPGIEARALPAAGPGEAGAGAGASAAAGGAGGLGDAEGPGPATLQAPVGGQLARGLEGSPRAWPIPCHGAVPPRLLSPQAQGPPRWIRLWGCMRATCPCGRQAGEGVAIVSPKPRAHDAWRRTAWLPDRGQLRGPHTDAQFKADTGRFSPQLTQGLLAEDTDDRLSRCPGRAGTHPSLAPSAEGLGS